MKGLVVNSTSPNMPRVKSSKEAAPIQKWIVQPDFSDEEGLKMVPPVVLLSITELSDNCQHLLPVSRPLCGRQRMNDLRFQRRSFKQKSWRHPKGQQLRGARDWSDFSVCGAAWWDC
jgi:hypothetical protein